MLDNILGREEILSNRYQRKGNSSKLHGPYWNFINGLTAFREQTMKGVAISTPYKKWDKAKGYYLKLHGSIDWHFCPNEACRGNRKVFPYLKPEKNMFCSECHERLEALIIPPVMNKDYRNYPTIRKALNIASKEIQFAKELIIWGYSLPPTDFYCSWLLRQARGKILKRLVIINPEVATKMHNEKKAFTKHFIDVFYGYKTKLDVQLFETYTDFLKNNEIKCLSKTQHSQTNQPPS